MICLTQANTTQNIAHAAQAKSRRKVFASHKFHESKSIRMVLAKSFENKSIIKICKSINNQSGVAHLQKKMW